MATLCKVVRGLLLTLLWATMAVHAQERSFIFALDASHMMPLGQHDSGTPVPLDGIVYRIEEALAAKLGVRATFKTLPTRRLETALQTGDADAFCYVKPQWVQAPVGTYQWSRVIFHDNDLLVRHADAPEVVDLAQLQNLQTGTKIGTLLGYTYPELAPLFTSGKLIRDDTYLLQSNFQKLLARRFDYMVVNQTTFDYYMARNAQHKDRLVPATILARNPLRCALSAQSPITLAHFDAALESLQKEGRIAAILGSYR